MTRATTPISIEDIAVGSQVKFVCTREGCTSSFIRHWMPNDSAGRGFGDPKCYMHGVDRPLMVISEVRS